MQDKCQDPQVFSDFEQLNELNKEIKVLSANLQQYNQIKQQVQQNNEMAEFLQQEFSDELVNSFNEDLQELNNKTNELYLTVLLSDEYDGNSAILKIHSGAGGTEACDWADMLFRMYTMYADKNGFHMKVYDKVEGEEAGIKSVTFEVNGVNAYGYLKGEMGVHRLVRISPFDSNKRRHTSFASVEVMPLLKNDNQTITINPEEVRIDTYRSSGAGGQHVNKTDSAIRITHLSTGIVVTCQNERSQLQNKETAFMILKSKLLQLKQLEQQQKDLALKGQQKKIEWGSQIRSYVFAPYTMVKDHRTEYETSNVQSVMDGYINEFIIQYLKWWNN